MANTPHSWRFFRAGGFDQVRLDRGSDIAHLGELDQKLWVALACPTTGLEFDARTLRWIDTDQDGRIRTSEIVAAARWAVGCLKNPDDLLRRSPSLPLSAINDATPEGKQLLDSARQILANLGKPGATEISVEDTGDETRIFAQSNFNGDGIIPADAASDELTRSVIGEIIACVGSDADRSGRPGISRARLDQFFAEAAAYSAWRQQAEVDSSIQVLGEGTAGAYAAMQAVRAKVDDYFGRCRLAAFDPRALGALNRQETEYLTLAAQEMTATAAQAAGFPLAHVEPGKSLPLVRQVNPAWAAALAALRSAAIVPLLGERMELTEVDWAEVCAKLSPFEAWTNAKAGAAVEKLGIKRIREILASPARDTIAALIARDLALEPEARSMAAVDRLVRYHRDLAKLLNNFVSFRDFYSRKDKAIFQAGTLYLDQRSCDLCVRVEDMGRHAVLAALSHMYLAYCDCVRKNTGEKMTILAGFTGGDSDNLMVGRNGIFYDRQGRDWDATVVKIVENPISIRQAFWAPYKKVIRFIEEQVAKRAATADAIASAQLQTTATTVAGPTHPVPAAPAKSKIDTGTLAAIGLVLATLLSALAGIFGAFAKLPLWQVPFAIAGILLAISIPSTIIAWLKLRQRNLGPILDANGWAVNARAKINVPFGGSLTAVAALPPGSHRDLVDPYAESHATRNRWIILLVLVALLAGAWFFGLAERVIPGVFPKSPWTVEPVAPASHP